MAASPGTHYETLGLETHATPEQVEQAFRLHAALYSPAALATYSLLDPREIHDLRLRVQQAYEVLRDAVRRRQYDISLSPETPGPVLPFPMAAPPPSGPEASASVLQAPVAPQLHRAEPQVLPEPVTGADLKRFRLSRGVRLEDIASTSKIGARFLEYIEADRHSHLPAHIYLRNFLYEYARAVGLEPRRTAESYMSRLPRES